MLVTHTVMHFEEEYTLDAGKVGGGRLTSETRDPLGRKLWRIRVSRTFWSQNAGERRRPRVAVHSSGRQSTTTCGNTSYRFPVLRLRKE